GDLRIYVKQLEDGSKAVGFCNFGLDRVTMPYKEFGKLGIVGQNTVRDLWRQKDIKSMDTAKDQLDIEVPAHGVLLYTFVPKK
ncbi:MAG: alpha-galactosidase, partial [Bacteroidales bacterium]|nr:alpha-galactosidase [Bacteroidales bacterium]